MKKAHLLSIGINEYDYFQTLGLCVNDSKSINESFCQRYSGVSVVVINDEHSAPTSDVIRAELANIESLSYGEDDVVIFFFAGHGFSLYGKDYVTAKDTNIDSLESAISTDSVIDCLKKSGAGNVILVIDACRTNISRSVNVFGENTAELSRRYGVVTYFSCSPGETAKELTFFNGGVFTTAFSELLSNKEIPFTPFLFNRLLIENLNKVCVQHKLVKRTHKTQLQPKKKAINFWLNGVRL